MAPLPAASYPSPLLFLGVIRPHHAAPSLPHAAFGASCHAPAHSQNADHPPMLTPFPAAGACRHRAHHCRDALPAAQGPQQAHVPLHQLHGWAGCQRRFCSSVSLCCDCCAVLCCGCCAVGLLIAALWDCCAALLPWAGRTATGPAAVRCGADVRRMHACRACCRHHAC